MPQWMLALATAHSSINGAGPREETDWAKVLAGAPEGQRHAEAARIAGRLLGKGLTPPEVEQIVLGFAARCSPPFPPGEVKRIVHDLAEKDRARAADDAAASDSVVPLGIGLGQFLARKFPPAEPYIEGLLSDDGGGWLGGEEKLGKTYLCPSSRWEQGGDSTDSKHEEGHQRRDDKSPHMPPGHNKAAAPRHASRLRNKTPPAGSHSRRCTTPQGKEPSSPSSFRFQSGSGRGGGLYRCRWARAGKRRVP